MLLAWSVRHQLSVIEIVKSLAEIKWIFVETSYTMGEIVWIVVDMVYNQVDKFFTLIEVFTHIGKAWTMFCQVLSGESHLSCCCKLLWRLFGAGRDELKDKRRALCRGKL